MSKTLRQAFVRTIPVMGGYLVLGFGFGILMRNAGLGLGWTAAMSLLIYAGSLQYVGVSLLTGAASLPATFLTSLMVNARHLFYSISMLEKYREAKRKPYLVFALTDETYTLLCGEDLPEGKEREDFCFFVSLLNHCYWVTGGVLGSLAGSVLPFSTAGIEFSMTALFLAAFTEQWLSTREHLPALTGLLGTFLCLFLFGKQNFLIPSMILITAVLLLCRGFLDNREERKEERR